MLYQLSYTPSVAGVVPRDGSVAFGSKRAALMPDPCGGGKAGDSFCHAADTSLRAVSGAGLCSSSASSVEPVSQRSQSSRASTTGIALG